MSELPNIVLVHGAWADGSSWSAVVERLQSEGYPVTAPQFPETSLADDVGRLRRVLKRQSGPTIVGGHSYGGQIMTSLGTDAPNVIALVYIAASGLDEGESLGALLGGGPPTPALAHLIVDEQGFAWLPEEDFVAHFAADVDPVKARVMYAVQQALSMSTFEDVMGVPAWKSQPTWYLVASEDQAIPPDAERMFAKRMGATTVEVASSHRQLPLLLRATEMPLANFQQNDQLGEIVIDNPPMNLFGGQLLTDLRAAADEAAESGIRALLLRAEGDDFSAGAEVSVFIELDEAVAKELETTVLSLIGAIEDLPVPPSLIRGQCYAGALEVCLGCDLIWAAEGSQIGQIEALAGGIPYAGGTQRIASRIGAGRAAEMVFTAAILPPETLASWGLINRVVVPPDGLAGEGRAFAQTLAAGPTRAHATTRRVLHAWRSGGVAAADRVTHAEGPTVMLSQDLQDGIASLRRDGPGHATFNNR